MHTMGSETDADITFSPSSGCAVKNVITWRNAPRVPLVKIKCLVNNDSSFPILDISFNKSVENCEHSSPVIRLPRLDNNYFSGFVPHAPERVRIMNVCQY
jgi:hypothetical protein